MLPLLLHTQPHASPARGCVDLNCPSLDMPAGRGDDLAPRDADSSFSAIFKGATTANATPPLSPWTLAGHDGQQRASAPPAAETRIDRDRRQGRRRRG